MFARNWKILLHLKTKKLASLAKMKLWMSLFVLQKTKIVDGCFVMNWNYFLFHLTTNFVELLSRMIQRLRPPMTIVPQLLLRMKRCSQELLRMWCRYRLKASL